MEHDIISSLVVLETWLVVQCERTHFSPSEQWLSIIQTQFSAERHVKPAQQISSLPQSESFVQFELTKSTNKIPAMSTRNIIKWRCFSIVLEINRDSSDHHNGCELRKNFTYARIEFQLFELDIDTLFCSITDCMTASDHAKICQ